MFVGSLHVATLLCDWVVGTCHGMSAPRTHFPITAVCFLGDSPTHPSTFHIYPLSAIAVFVKICLLCGCRPHRRSPALGNAGGSAPSRHRTVTRHTESVYSTLFLDKRKSGKFLYTSVTILIVNNIHKPQCTNSVL